MLPSVSVIIPTYNYAQFITDAVNAVLSQAYPPELIEIIVVDDGSTDNTKEVLQPFIANGLKYYYQQNKGKASATYFGIQKSTGKYIFNLDADDYFLPGKLIKTVAVFEDNDEIVHVGTPAKRFFNDTKILADYEKMPVHIAGKLLDGNWLLQYFYKNNILYGGGSTYAARASVLKPVNIPAAVDMFIDEFLILAILPSGKSFFIEEELSVWRDHNANYSSATKTPEKKILKEQRLVNSSVAILNYLIEHKFDESLIKIYKLKNLNRGIAFKESLNNKKLADIFNYARNVFINIRPGFSIIKKYQVLNRLIPMRIFRFLKGFLK